MELSGRWRVFVGAGYLWEKNMLHNEVCGLDNWTIESYNGVCIVDKGTQGIQ